MIDEQIKGRCFQRSILGEKAAPWLVKILNANAFSAEPANDFEDQFFKAQEFREP